MTAPNPFERPFIVGRTLIILEQVYSAIAVALRALRGQAMAMSSGPEWRVQQFRNFPCLRALRSRLCTAALETWRVLQELDLKYVARRCRSS